MAIKGLSPWVFRRELKPDTCLATPAQVYRGSHSPSNFMGLVFGYTTLAVEVVDPMRAYDC